MPLFAADKSRRDLAEPLALFSRSALPGPSPVDDPAQLFSRYRGHDVGHQAPLDVGLDPSNCSVGDVDCDVRFLARHEESLREEAVASNVGDLPDDDVQEVAVLDVSGERPVLGADSGCPDGGLDDY